MRERLEDRKKERKREREKERCASAGSCAWCAFHGGESVREGEKRNSERMRERPHDGKNERKREREKERARERETCWRGIVRMVRMLWKRQCVLCV